MKILKYIACTTFIFALSLSFTSKAFADGKKPVREECRDPSTGELSGYSGSCVAGGGNCITTACAIFGIAEIQ